MGDGLRIANVAGDGGGVGKPRGEAVERALVAGGEDEMEAAFGERLGDGQTEAARGSGDDSELGACGHQKPLGAFWRSRERNSLRVSCWRKTPSMAEVTAAECCFSTPRIIMQRWRASMTTPTPCGWMIS